LLVGEFDAELAEQPPPALVVSRVRVGKNSIDIEDDSVLAGHGLFDIRMKSHVTR
jgi:hypothetical protein